MIFDRSLGFPGGSDGEESTCNSGDLGSVPGSGICPGEVNGYPIQYWRIPWTEELGGVQSMGLPRVGHNRVTNSLLTYSLRFRNLSGFFYVS